MSATDPLDTLRAAVSANHDITTVNASGAPAGSLRTATHLRLSATTTLPKNAPTRLRKPGSSGIDPTSHPDGFFMLEAVYLAWLLCDTPAGGFVSLTERKSIVDCVNNLGNIIPLLGVSSFLSDVVHSQQTLTRLGSTRSPPPFVHRRLPASSSSTTHTQVLSSTSTRQRGDVGATTSPSKRRYVPNSTDVEVVKRIRQGEVELNDHNTVLRGVKNTNFSSVRDACASVAKLKSLKEAKKTGGVSASVTTPLSGRLIHVHHSFSAETTPFVDSKAHARKQIVFVLTTGQSEPRVLFHHVKGIYVSWTSGPPNPKVKDWNVTELKIDPHRRHVDKSTVAYLWKTLDTWTALHKPSLVNT
ncbi:hypothetical protein BGW80DRAFT_1439042 [Lactifluus volemus]|nr:hypothetical protein BGW80DRAFT_1439042 [Lactifluus volemus]